MVSSAQSPDGKNEQPKEDNDEPSGNDDIYSAFMKYSGRRRVSEEELHARLDAAYPIFLKGGTSSREGVIAALDTVIGFLESKLFLVSNSEGVGFLTDRQLLPLRRLLIALHDVSDGVVHDVLKPQKARRGAAGLTKTDAEFRLLCATAASLLEAKLGDGAADLVAKRLNKLGFNRKRKDRAENPKGIVAGTVKNWQRVDYEFKAQVLSRSSLSFEAWLDQQYLAIADTLEVPPRVYLDALVKGDDALAAFMEGQAYLILDHILPALFGHLRKKK